MFQFFQCLYFWFISISTKSICESATHAVVGNYKQLNPKDCGITRLTEGYDDMCFEWNRNTFSEMKHGRNVTYADEVPWIVSFNDPDLINPYNHSNEFEWCSGSLIANKWVITAKHCTKSSWVASTFGIFFGHGPHNISSKQEIKAIKLYDYNPTNDPQKGMFDVSLFELEENPRDKYPNVRSICLPEPNIINEGPEYVLSAGWGRIYRRKHPLQIAVQVLMHDFNATIRNSSKDQGQNARWGNMAEMIWTRSINYKTIMCSGDSGGPLWQFHNGRAILLGVASYTWNEKVDSCDNMTEPELVVGYTDVSKVIDWIKNVTQLN